MCAFLLCQFISAVVERGMPTQPLYYVFAAIGILLGFLTYRLTRTNIAKQRPVLVLVAVVLCIGVPIACYYSGIDILRQISGSQFWYILSLLGFEGFAYTKKLRSRTEPTQAEENTEYMSKGLVLYILVMAVLFLPIFLIILIALVLSSC